MASRAHLVLGTLAAVALLAALAAPTGGPAVVERVGGLGYAGEWGP